MSQTQTSSRVALLGGSFNPPHVGHQMMCLWALSTGRADQVWFVPAYEHPFGKFLAPFRHRQQMCELAAATFPDGRVSVSAIEAELKGPSRTLTTLQHLVARHPDCRFSLLIGADIVAQRRSWFRFDAIENLADVIVVGRRGYPAPLATIEMAPISSTDIREGLARGRDVSACLPASVYAHIKRHQLYGSRSGLVR